MTSATCRRALALAGVLFAPFAVACSRSDAKAVDSPGPRRAHADGPPVIVPTGYAADSTGTAAGGRITGTAGPDGAMPVDSTLHPGVDGDVCGASLADVATPHRADGLGNVVVWLADVKTGKRLPLARRFDVAVERCAIDPRVQAVLTGGTLDVASGDELLHSLRFTRQGTGDSLGVVSASEAGSVVPVRVPVSAASLVGISDARHPWERGWIAVFDHPYYAVTGPDGRFTLDSVPAGTYSLHAWHERLGVTTQSVTVGGGETAVVVKLVAH